MHRDEKSRISLQIFAKAETLESQLPTNTALQEELDLLTLFQDLSEAAFWFSSFTALSKRQILQKLTYRVHEAFGLQRAARALCSPSDNLSALCVCLCV